MSALWTSDEVARALAPVAMTAPFEANGVTFDSRAVTPGDLFFALAGETTDGHAFVGEALKRGAAAAVVSRDVAGAGGNLIRVPDTMKALVDLGRAGRSGGDAGFEPGGFRLAAGPGRQRHRSGCRRLAGHYRDTN